MSRADLDLKIAAGVAVLAIVVAAADAPSAVRAVPATLLVLVLPGYVLSVALLPAQRDPFERLLLTVGLSICVAVLGGLLIDRTGAGLTGRSWSVALGLFTIAACVVAGKRRAETVDEAPPATAPLREEKRVDGRRLGVTALGVAVVAVVVGAIVIARLPSSSAHVLGSTALWIKPEHAPVGAFSVGVRSDEIRRTTYRLVASVDETHGVLIRTNLTLAPGEERTVNAAVPVPSGIVRTVRVSLYRAGRPSVPYRQVHATFQGPIR
jgi:uncharacterized membrane protein